MSTEFTNYALFGDATFELTDALTLLFGLRYTDDEVSYKHNRRNNDEFGRRGVGVRQAALDTDFSGSTDENNLSGKIGAQLSLDDNSMIYATYSTGYKGPAFNVFYNMSVDDTNPIEAETSDSVEIGYKYTGEDIFLALALYETKIDDFQANDFDASDGVTTTGFTNGGDVETKGAEIDFQWQASDNLKLIGGVAISNAETTLGDDLPFAPDSKYSVSGEYTIPVSDGSSWAINTAVVHTDEQLSGNIGQNEQTNPEVLLPDYTVVNASVTYNAPEDRYSASLIAKNLTDETYATTYSGDGFRYQIPRDAERYFGVNFRFNF